MLKHFTKGINWRDPRLVKSPRIWIQYLAWCLGTMRLPNRLVYPMWLRRLLLERVFKDTRRHGISKRTLEIWKKIDPAYVPEFYPLPWWVGPYAIGPFNPLGQRLQTWLRSYAGGRSHRCEFTDPNRGALYGGQEGGYMNTMFEQFIANLDNEEGD